MIINLMKLISLMCLIFTYDSAFSQTRFLETEGVGNIIYDSTFTYGTEEKGVQIPKFIDLSVMQEFSGVTIRSSKPGAWTRCNLPLKGKIGLTGVTNRQLAFKCRPLN